MFTGLMQQSKIGEGNVQSSAASVNMRRTSSTVLLDSTVVGQHPQLQPMVLQLQSKAQKLLGIGVSSLWCYTFCLHTSHLPYALPWAQVLRLH